MSDGIVVMVCMMECWPEVCGDAWKVFLMIGVFVEGLGVYVLWGV